MKVTRFDFPDFSKTRTAISDVFSNLPTWAGNAALNFYKDSWRRQGFIDTSFKRWPKRKKEGGSKDRAILVKSGQLRRSLRLRVGTTWFEVYSEVPYAKAHNEGATITQTVTPRQRRYFWAMHYKAKKVGKSDEAGQWRAMALSETITIKIPRRQFMGQSNFMERRIVANVERALQYALR